jgi:redox-sensitive bicupin YhaK (pirin superfamily)
MEKDNNHNRRSFLGKLTLGFGTLAAAPFIAISQKLNSKVLPEMTTPVKKIKPLGFVWETADPFLFCVHHEDKFPKGNEGMGPAVSLEGRNIGDDFIIKDGFRMYHGDKIPGFPGHPHRGFETVTVVREGLVDHADSLGAAGRYGEGDVQWMTAGKGVQHSEMFPLLNRDKDNPMELFQIWLNLPAKRKMAQPYFKMLWSEAIPKLEFKDDKGNSVKVEVIAGKLQNAIPPSAPPDSWAAQPENDVAIWNIQLEPNAAWKLPAALAGINRTLYFYKGESIQLSGVNLPNYHAAEVQSDIDLLIQNGPHLSKILVLQGRPISEPVMQYGPFVMNTKEEIQQAFDDYHKTKFGGWPWPVAGQVHARTKGRFAKHADGRIEEKA